MKLFYDLFKSLFARIVILFLVAVILITLEANKQNQAYIESKETTIRKDIQKIDKKIDALRTNLERKNARQRELKASISSKTGAISKRKAALEKSRKGRLKDKLPLWEVVDHLNKMVILNISRAALLIDYSQLMFSIVDTNKAVAEQTIKKTKLNNKLIIVQTSNLVDHVLKQASPVDLLTPGGRLLLLALFYALFFGALTLKGINFYLFAPLARKTRPIIINPVSGDKTDVIHYDTPQKEFKLQLEQGCSLVVKPGWYSLNTEGITRTRFFWDRSNPFASYAMGLVNMIEFESDNDQVREIRLASDEDPNQSIIPVHLKDHPGYVVRHGHVVATSGNDLVMKKTWQIWDWKSWLFGNIRYVYYSGTGSLYISGHGNIATNHATAGSRIKERHIVGFDSGSPIKMSRTETFTNYWLNNRPLYDIHFPEQGRFLQQQSFGQRDDKVFRSLFEDIIGAIGKLLGF